jgi:hypothetical protein
MRTIGFLETTMPLVTVSSLAPKTPAFKSAVFDSVHAALVEVGVPQADLFQRFIALGEEDFRFDPQYPDVAGARTQDFVLVEVLWSVGRSVKVKKQFLAKLRDHLRSRGHDPENLMLVFKETNWENWSFAGGRQIHV